MPRHHDSDPRLTKRQQENLRARITSSAAHIVNRLQQAAQGEVEMKPTEVKAAQILLDRVLPTMQAIDQTTHSEQPEMSPEELDEMLAQAIRDMARRDPDKLAAIMQPTLRVIEGGK